LEHAWRIHGSRMVKVIVSAERGRSRVAVRFAASVRVVV
jgi:hypothetical protein